VAGAFKSACKCGLEGQGRGVVCKRSGEKTMLELKFDSSREAFDENFVHSGPVGANFFPKRILCSMKAQKSFIE
jgi:hypothetical protein